MDSRKFLGAINNSAQSKIAFIESRVREMGKAAGASWRLACLRGDDLFIEDIDSHQYMVADHRRERGGRVVIDNIRPIRIVESKKKSLFEASCLQLVNAVEDNNQKEMQAAFSKMANQRFSSRVVPFSGKVRTHDGRVRNINVASDTVLGDDIRPRLVSAIVEAVTNQVVVREGRVVSGTFNPPVKLPITEWVCRKAVARQMRTVAEGAYWSPGFQERVYSIAKMIYDDKIVEAVKTASTFLAENQEFTLLNRAKTQVLVENALATKACFNQQLCNNTATLLWRTNLKVNKRTIIDEWRTTAKKAGHSVLLDNVRMLEESRDFEAAYNKFIDLVFNEAIGPKEVQVDAYRVALQALKETPKIKGTGDLSTKIDELIERLQQPETDYAVISEVEDLLAEVKNEMNALDNLQNFDQMPGGNAGANAPGNQGTANNTNSTNNADPLAGLAGDSGGSGSDGAGTNVTFNISIGKDGNVSTDEDDGEDEEGDDELAKLLGGDDDNAGAAGAAGGGAGGGAGNAAGGAGAGGGTGAGSARGGAGGNDALAKMLGGEGVARHGSGIAENTDPYAMTETEHIVDYSPRMGADYGIKPIEVAEDCMRAVNAMFRIIDNRGVSGDAIGEGLENLAKAGMAKVGLMIPGHKMDEAIEQICEVFIEECGRRVTLGEEQYKWNWSYRGSRKRSKYGKAESRQRHGRTVRESTQPAAPASGTGGTGGLRWLERQDDGLLGEFRDIRFILDHGGDSQLEPIIMSEDGRVEVPIPSDLYDSAFAAAKMAAGNPKPFMRWLNENIVQFGVSEEQDRALNEAMATIKAGPDGTISVEVDSEDPDVSVTGPDDGDQSGADFETMDDEAGEGMQPVSSIDSGDEMDGNEMDSEEPAVGLPEFGDEEDVEGDEETADAGPEEFGARDEGEGEGVEDDGIEGEGDEFGAEDGIEDDGDDSEIDDETRGRSRHRRRGPSDLGEDDDITEPRSKKYTATAKENPRKKPAAQKVPKPDNKVSGISDGGRSDADGGAGMKKVKPRQ